MLHKILSAVIAATALAACGHGGDHSRPLQPASATLDGTWYGSSSTAGSVTLTLNDDHTARFIYVLGSLHTDETDSWEANGKSVTLKATHEVFDVEGSTLVQRGAPIRLIRKPS